MDSTPQSPVAPSLGSRLFAAGLTLAFLAALLPISLHHPFWRDELQAWTIVRDSKSFGDMMHAIRYEGHPPVWYFLLDAAQHFTADQMAMKWINVALETAAVAVVAFAAPWSKAAKILFAFGYFTFYEYGVLSRNYSAGLLLGFLACAILSARTFRPILLAAVLVLMGQTNAYAMIISMGVAVAAGVEWNCRKGNGATTVSRRRMLAFAAIVAAGVVLYGIELRQPADAGVVETWYTHTTTFDAFFRSFFPIPDQAMHFWNTNVLDEHPLWQWAASAAVALGALALVAGRPASLTLFIVAADGLVVFMFVKYLGFQRHQGHLFILFLMCDWLSRTATPWRSEPMAVPRWIDWPNKRKLPREAILLALLGLQAGVGVFAAWRDWVTPFSAARQTAQYLQANYPPDVPIVGDVDAPASAVCAFLGGRPIYYMEGHRWATYVQFDTQRGLPAAIPDMFDLARIMAIARNDQVVIVLSLGRDIQLPPEVQPIWRSSDAIVADETYEVFVVRR